MTAIATDRVRCRLCTRFVHPLEATGSERRGFTCQRCMWAWHFHALNVLAGGSIPKGCMECGSSWERLKENSGGVEVRMYAVPKDGIYQLLCAKCAAEYVPKRKDIYRDCEFGQRMKL